MGDLINKEVSKKQEIGQRIVECKDNYVDDDIVIDLIKKLVDKSEGNLIIEGFPRTRVSDGF